MVKVYSGIDAGGGRITGVGDAVEATDAVGVSVAEQRYGVAAELEELDAGDQIRVVRSDGVQASIEASTALSSDQSLRAVAGGGAREVIVTAAAGAEIVDMSQGSVVSITSTTAPVSLSFSNLDPSRVGEILVTYVPSNNGDTLTLPAGPTAGTLPSTFTAGDAYYYRLTYLPSIGQYLRESLGTITLADELTPVTAPDVQAVVYTDNTRSSSTALSTNSGAPTLIGTESGLADVNAYIGSTDTVFSRVRWFLWKLADLPGGLTLGDLPSVADEAAFEAFGRGDSSVPIDLMGGTTFANAWVTTADATGNNRAGYGDDGVYAIVAEGNTINGEQSLTTYYVEVDNAATPPTPPAAPAWASPAVTVQDNALLLDWDAAAGAATYQYRFGIALPLTSNWTSVGTDTTFTLTGLTAGQLYYVEVRSLDASLVPSVPSVTESGTPTGAGVGLPALSSPMQYFTVANSGANPAMRAGTGKGSRYVTSEVVWPFRGEWSFPEKDRPDKWANAFTASVDAAINKYQNLSVADGYLRNVQHPSNGGFGSQTEIDPDSGELIVMALMAAPVKTNAKPFSNSGNPINNHVLAALALARMADGQYSADLQALGQRVQTTTTGGVPEGWWAEHTVIYVANEFNASWFGNFCGITPQFVGESQLLNATGFSADVKQMLVNLATAGNPALEVLGKAPDASLDGLPAFRQTTYGDDTDAGFGGDLSVLAAAACRRMVDDIRSECPGALTSINWAHSGANPDGTGGESATELSRQINWRVARLIGRERFMDINGDAYCRSGMSPNFLGGAGNDIDNYGFDEPGGFNEFASEMEAAIAQFGRPFGSREWGICRKLGDVGGGVGCTDAQAAAFLNRVSNRTTGWLNTIPLSASGVWHYNAADQTQANRNIRYGTIKAQDPLWWEVQKEVWPGTGLAPGEFYVAA